MAPENPPVSNSSIILVCEISFSYYRIAFNDGDSYHGKYILDTLNSGITANSSKNKSEDNSFEIVTTINDGVLDDDDNIKIVSREQFMAYSLNSGFVIIDITTNTENLKLALDFIKALDILLTNELCGKKPMVQERNITLLSTVMTWALTNPLDPQTPAMAFIGADYRKRRPHPNYDKHFAIENEFIKLAKKYPQHLNLVVVGAGIMYGGKEDVLKYWFQSAWEYQKILPIIGNGRNVIPLIHVQDLANVILKIIDKHPDATYLFAVEPNITTQNDIVKSISKLFGSGIFKCIPKEDAFLIDDIKQRDYDMMTINKLFDPIIITEHMDVKTTFYWQTESFSAKIPNLIKEFKSENKLKAYKVVIHGPPGIGKTTVAKEIVKNYGLVYISPETIVKERIEDLVWRLEQYEELNEGENLVDLEEEDEFYLPETDTDDWENYMSNARNDLEVLKSGIPIDNDDILNYIKNRLKSNDCINKGWVLDGYPEHRSQCIGLFAKQVQNDSESESENVQSSYEKILLQDYKKKLLPTIVVTMNAKDEYIKDQILNSPECELRNTKLEEITFMKRLTEFRKTNAKDDSPLMFFKELGYKVFTINVDSGDVSLDLCYKWITFQIGHPCSYKTLTDNIAETEKLENEEKCRKEKEHEAFKKGLEESLKQEKEERLEYWSQIMTLMREEEEQILATQSELIINYLINFILPVLVKGLIKVTEIKPDDPIDFLAEYLFKNNSSGRMFEPGFDLQREISANRIQILDPEMLNVQIVIPEESVSSDSICSIISLPAMRMFHSTSRMKHEPL